MKKRVYFLDYLRVMTIFAVIFVHVIIDGMNQGEVSHANWLILEFYNVMSRWAMPILVMVSGSIFLNREIPIQTLYSKYILRMLTSFLFWGFLYAMILDHTWTARIEKIFCGQFHMWFIPMIIGLYACVPFLKAISEKSQLEVYFILLSFGLTIVRTVMEILGAIDHDACRLISGILESNLGNMHFDMVAGYTGYFLLGHYFMNHEIKKQTRKNVYIAAVIALLIRYLLFIKGFAMIDGMIEAAALFLFFQYRDFSGIKLTPFVSKLSNYSFGAYLVHVIVFGQVNTKLHLNAVAFFPPVAAVVTAMVSYVIAFGISCVLNHIPYLKKYIV